MRLISDLAHWFEGGVLLVAALLALLAAWRLMKGAGRQGTASAAWAIVVFGAGVFLGGYLLIPHHGLANTGRQWAFVFGDPQQRQHVALAGLLLLGSGMELLVAAGRVRSRMASFVWPLCLSGAGLLFVLHTQHGTSAAVARAVLVHRVLGLALITAAVLRAVEVVALGVGATAPTADASRLRWLRFAWPSVLAAAAVLLLLYREPEGAYDDHRASPGTTMPQSGAHDNMRTTP